MPFVIKQNDTLPNLRATLLNADNTPIDLSTATAVYLAVSSLDADPVWKHECDVIDALNGIVEYDFDATDTAEAPDTYNAEFEIQWGTEILTVPNDGYFTFSIVADLG